MLLFCCQHGHRSYAGVLKLDSWARMNTPGVGEGNWAWRFKASDLSKQLSDRLLETSKLYGRYTPIPEKKNSEEK